MVWNGNKSGHHEPPNPSFSGFWFLLFCFSADNKGVHNAVSPQHYKHLAMYKSNNAIYKTNKQKQINKSLCPSLSHTSHFP